MAATTNFSVRMDRDIKNQCELLYNELGINLTTAINVFLRQSIRAGGFPFDVRIDKPDVVESRAIRAMKQLSEEAKRNGTSDISLDEINAEIEAVRAERKARKGKA